MRVTLSSSLILALGMVAMGCRAPYCLEEVQRDREYVLHFGARTENATRWSSPALLRNAPASGACRNIDALGDGTSLRVRLEDAVVPGTDRCDGSLMTVEGDAGVALGAFTSGSRRAFASAGYGVNLSDTCRGEWGLSLFAVEGADPFAEPGSDGRPGLIIDRVFAPTAPGCVPQFLPQETSCEDHWAGRLEH